MMTHECFFKEIHEDFTNKLWKQYEEQCYYLALASMHNASNTELKFRTIRELKEDERINSASISN